MARARICDMCGCIISTERQKCDPVYGYTVTLQKSKFLKTETISIDLCEKCFDQIIEISKRKEQDDGQGDKSNL